MIWSRYSGKESPSFWIQDSVSSRHAVNSKRRLIQNGVLFKMSPYSKWRPIQNGVLFKMSSYSKWLPIQNGALFKMASYSKWRPIQNGVLFKMASYSKWRPLFAASAPGRGEGGWTPRPPGRLARPLPHPRHCRQEDREKKVDILRGTFHLKVFGNEKGWRAGKVPNMDKMSIKTPNPKCCLYWCLIEFIDWRYSESCVYFRPLLWTSAPLTFLLVQLPPPPQTPDTWLASYSIHSYTIHSV